MYVSRGIGTSLLPLRLGSPPELVVLDWHLRQLRFVSESSNDLFLVGRAADTVRTGSLFFPLCAVVLSEQSIVLSAGNAFCSRSPEFMSCA